MSPPAGRAQDQRVDWRRGLMATDVPDMPAENAGGPRLWQRMWSHRERLLEVARRRSMSPEDARTRCTRPCCARRGAPTWTTSASASWLTTVTMRLCVDRHRRVDRGRGTAQPDARRADSSTMKEAVCDQAEGRSGWPCERGAARAPGRGAPAEVRRPRRRTGRRAHGAELSHRRVAARPARRTLRNSLRPERWASPCSCGGAASCAQADTRRPWR